MNESELRQELLSTIQALAEVAPEMQVGQLVAALGELCADIHGRGLWDASDAELLEATWQFRRDFEAAINESGREGMSRQVGHPRILE